MNEKLFSGLFFLPESGEVTVARGREWLRITGGKHPCAHALKLKTYGIAAARPFIASRVGALVDNHPCRDDGVDVDRPVSGVGTFPVPFSIHGCGVHHQRGAQAYDEYLANLKRVDQNV